MTTVVQALAAVMDEVQAVRKDGKNTAQNFNFRGIDAVMNAVGPALRKHGVVIVPTLEESNYRDIEVGQKRTLMREVTVKVRYTVHGPEGDTIEGVVCGESMDSGDKGTAKAFSVAYRTFLLQALTIPTDDPEPDEQTFQRAARAEAKPAEPKPLTGWSSIEQQDAAHHALAEEIKNSSDQIKGDMKAFRSEKGWTWPMARESLNEMREAFERLVAADSEPKNELVERVEKIKAKAQA